jgi:phenylacetate-CoA ligase
MNYILDKLYYKSPIWLQNLAISSYGIFWHNKRFGGEFNELLNQYIDNEKLSETDFLSYQTIELRKLLNYSYKNVNYYRNVFKHNNITLDSIKDCDLGILSSLPVLNKDKFRKNEKKLTSNEFDFDKLYIDHTSGTSGSPMAIRHDIKLARAFSAAYEARCRKWAGVDYKMSRAMIGGRPIIKGDVVTPPFWRFNWIEKQLYMSAFHISHKTAEIYVNELNNFKPKYIVGYSSAINTLAKLIIKKNLKLTFNPIAVLCSSDMLLNEMRANIEEAFSTKVFDSYAGAESGVLISECIEHRYHVSPDVGIVEILKDGKKCDFDEVGEIVFTGLLNYAQPLIRYNTGDLASFSSNKCNCGLEMPIIKNFDGRKEDAIIMADGRESYHFELVFKGIKGVTESQVFQKDYNKFLLRIVKDNNFDDIQKNRLVKNIETRYGSCQINFEFVSEINRTKSGKFKLVINEMNN